MYRILILLVSFFACWNCGLRAASPDIALDKFLPELIQAFHGWGAFQASYRIETPGLSANLTYYLNQENFITGFILIPDTAPEERFSAVMKYGGPDMEEGDLHIIMGKSAPMQIMKLNTTKIISKPPAILHALLLLSNESVLRVNSQQKKISTDSFWPLLAFGLQANSLKLSFGLQSSTQAPSTNWLTPAYYDNAEDISLTKETVIVDFPENHQVILNRTSGLLQSDRWPNNEKDQPIRITLIEHKALNKNFSISDIIPQFERLAFQEIPATSIIAPAVASACLQLNEKLENIEDLNDWLTKDPAATHDRIRNRARPQVREWANTLVADFKQQTKINAHLQNEYQRLLQSKPTTVKDISYAAFLAKIRDEVENDPQQVIFPYLEAVVIELQTSYEEMLALLPLEKDAALLQVYNSYMDALSDAWRIELMTATLERAQEDEREAP
ncbi:hypothetical protein P3T73_05685 [Kiritimatiellota bacterium B12222]|nr:hypothetical protein P3T73_05685 [Kiritimatiellota bacterium B12222]